MVKIQILAPGKYGNREDVRVSIAASKDCQDPDYICTIFDAAKEGFLAGLGRSTKVQVAGLGRDVVIPKDGGHMKKKILIPGRDFKIKGRKA